MTIRWIAAVTFAFGLAAHAQTLDVQRYSTTGHPTEALSVDDGKYILVTVARANGSGIDVFRNTGKKLDRVAFQSVGVDHAQGILRIPGTRMLAVGLSDAGVGFLSLDEALTGNARVGVLRQGDRSGSGYLAVTPDGATLFVANEYGDRGNVGVIALQKDAAGKVHPVALAQIPTPNTTPGIALSPDGSRLYAAAEVVSPDAAARLPGHGVADLERDACREGAGGHAYPNGALYVIDVTKATADPHHAVLTRVDAGCSPVREAVTEDGTVWLTARGDNNILGFDAGKLASDPDHAFLRAIPTGGEAPVGLHPFPGGKLMLVANSNRFAGGAGTLIVLDLATGKAVQTIKTGPFPRNIATGPDGSLLVTVYSGDELLVVRQKQP